MSIHHETVSILLVEDDDVDAMAVLRGLKKLNCQNPVYRAKNGVEALNILRGEAKSHILQRPYIILLDLNMPIMGGLDFLKVVREDETLGDSVIFVLTTSDADEDLIAAYSEHIAGYILKSEMNENCSDVIEMLLNYWRLVVLPD